MPAGFRQRRYRRRNRFAPAPDRHEKGNILTPGGLCLAEEIMLRIRSSSAARPRVQFLGMMVSIVLASVQPSPAGISGQLESFNTTQPYLIYYGDWTSAQVDYARTNYHLVIVHPGSNITSNQIAAIKRGKDNIAGTPDDVRV